MAMQKATLGALALVAVAVVVIGTIGALVASRTFSSTGSITAVGVGVYSDSNCTTVLSSVNWGTLNPGDTKTYAMFVQNNGTVPVTLTMATSRWSPAVASSYINVTWNRQNYVLPAGSVVQATLTMAVSSGISDVTTFGFDTTITGTQ